MNITLKDVYRAVHGMVTHGKQYDADKVAARLAPPTLDSATILSRFVSLYPELMEKHGHCENVKTLMREMLDILIEAYTLEAARAIYDVRNKINRGNK